MAMLFAKRLPDGRESPRWYNTIEASFMSHMPSNIEMLTDIVLTHSRIDYLLGKIIVGLLYYKKTNLDDNEIDSFVRVLAGEISFMQKVKIIEEITCGKRVNTFKDLPDDLKKMAFIRNRIAHNDITHTLISERFSKDVAIALEKIIPTDKMPSKKLIVKPFRDYSKYYDKYFGFFSADIGFQIKELMGDKNE